MPGAVVRMQKGAKLLGWTKRCNVGSTTSIGGF